MGDPLENPRYRNWVRATLGLRQLQLGLVPYVDKLAREKHYVLFGSLRRADPLHRHISPCPILHNKDGCTVHPIRHSTDSSNACQSCNFDTCRTCGLSCCQSCGHLDVSHKQSTICTSNDLKTCKDCKETICTKCCAGMETWHCEIVDQGQNLEKDYLHDAPCVFELCKSCEEMHCSTCNVPENDFCKCSIKNIKPSHSSNNCISNLPKYCNCKRSTPDCSKNACGYIYDVIIREHHTHNPNWGNTNPKFWRTSYWEVAKCFISGGGYNTLQQSAEKTDASGLLSICINSEYIRRHLKNISAFKKAINNRNDLFHACDSELSADCLQQHLDCMIAVLKDTLKIEGTAQISIDYISKLKSNNIEIKHQDSDDARKEAREALNQLTAGYSTMIEKQNRMEEAIEELKTTMEQQRLEYEDAKKNWEDVREDVKKLQLTYKDDAVTVTGAVTIGIENVTANEDHTISDDTVNAVNNIVQGRNVDMNDKVNIAARNGYSAFLEGKNKNLRRTLSEALACFIEGKRVTVAKSECIHLTIECTTFTALVSLFEECFTEEMTLRLKPLELAIQEKYNLPELRLVARMRADDFRASMKDVVSKIKKKVQIERRSNPDLHGRVTNVSTSPLEKTERKSLQAGTTIEDDQVIQTPGTLSYTSTDTHITNDVVEVDDAMDKGDTGRSHATFVSTASTANMLMGDVKAGTSVSEDEGSNNDEVADDHDVESHDQSKKTLGALPYTVSQSAGEANPTDVDGEKDNELTRGRLYKMSKTRMHNRASGAKVKPQSPHATFVSTASTANMLMGDMKTGSPVSEVKNVPISPLEKTERKSLQAGTSIEYGSMKISSVHCNHTDLTTSLCQHTGSTINIDDVVCEADKACGCTKTPSLYVPPSLSHSPGTTGTLKVKYLSVRHERESLMHIDSLPEIEWLTMKDSNYLLEPVGISNLIRIVNGSKFRLITMENIKCTHTDMNMLLSSLKLTCLTIDSLDCVPDDRCGCLKTESRNDSATIETSTMPEVYSSSHKHIDLLSETSGQRGHVSEFHTDYIQLTNNSNLPPHIVAKGVGEIYFRDCQYDTTNEHALFDAIERCGAKNVCLIRVRISPDVAWNVLRFLNKMNQYNYLTFINVSFPSKTDVEIFTEVIKQLPGIWYDERPHWKTAMDFDKSCLLNGRVKLWGLGQNLPSWEDAKVLLEEGRLKTFISAKSDEAIFTPECSDNTSDSILRGKGDPLPGLEEARSRLEKRHAEERQNLHIDDRHRRLRKADTERMSTKSLHIDDRHRRLKEADTERMSTKSLFVKRHIDDRHRRLRKADTERMSTKSLHIDDRHRRLKEADTERMSTKSLFVKRDLEDKLRIRRQAGTKRMSLKALMEKSQEEKTTRLEVGKAVHSEKEKSTTLDVAKAVHSEKEKTTTLDVGTAQ